MNNKLQSQPHTTGALTTSFANPFQQKGRWLKGNTHTHTVNSDGRWTFDEVRAGYGRHGYDFVFLTDHWKRTVPLPSADKPLLIPAEEVDFVLRGNVFHAACLGLRREWKRRAFRSLNELVRLAAHHGVFLVMAHPYWSGSRSEHYLRAAGFPAVEVYNTVCDRSIAKGYSGTYWDDLLDAGHRVLGIAADDAHSAASAFGGWIMVKATACTEAAILAALRRGHFYSTQGPEIHDIQMNGRRVTVTCSPVSRINFMTKSYFGKVVQSRGNTLTGAAWDMPTEVAYVRIECVDRNGRTAWSNPLWQPLDARRLATLKRRSLQTAVAPRLRGRPANGDPRQVDWPSARALTTWRTMAGETTRRRVEARLIHDGRYLYLQLEERLNPRRLIVKNNTVWDEDEWELFFADRLGRPCRQMGVNANGVHRALAHGKTPRPWQTDATVVSNTRRPDRWQVQIALPLAKLVDGGARPGDTVYVNIVRSTEQGNAVGWIPTFQTAYHDPSRLGAVRLA